MEVAIGKGFRRDVDARSVASLVANFYGFHLDMEPMEPGRYLLRAKSGDASFTETGSSVSEVYEKFVHKLIGE